VIDKGTTAAVNDLFSALEVATITDINIKPKDPSAGSTTNYEVIFSADTDVPKDSYVVITLPDEITVSGTNAGGNTVLDSCANLFNSSVTLTCTVGTDADGKTTIRIDGLFPEDLNSGQFGLDLGLLDNPSTAGDTGSFQIDIFSPSDAPVASKDVDTPTTIKTPIADAD
jgi:hypothetical protein